LPARQLDPPLADDRLVAVRELVDELVAVRNAAGVLDLVQCGAGLCVADVLGDRAVKQEVLLQH
jgi:hypothetical protein